MKPEEFIDRYGNFVRSAMLSVGVIVTVISVKDTYELVTIYAQLNRENRRTGGVSNSLDQTIADRSFAAVDINAVVFEAMGDAANLSHVLVKEIGTLHVRKEDGFHVLTQEVIIEGDFLNIVRCLDSADSKLGTIKISSLKFERSGSGGSSALVLKVVFQIVTVDNEAS